jgi:dipeptidyl aminopeptidase/acylaminoacyl peptidase
MEGWFAPPADRDFDDGNPLLLSVHGGPHGMYGYSLARNLSLQILAARGYAVLYLNPRGSSGYGQKFSDGCVNDWGGGDYKDLMAGVDHILKRFPWLDPDRLGVLGSSYGGYMTNWIVTQTPRFRAAVATASLSNLISFYATSLYQDLVHADFQGFPWEGDNYERLWDRSPLKHAAKVRTPTLFLHGEQDHDVHMSDAEQMYVALRRRGVDAQLVRYPREGHGFQEPHHRTDALERTIEWLDRYLVESPSR